jgi:hypothetical protein
MRRSAAYTLLGVLFAGCGGSPTAPERGDLALRLSPGGYRLVLSVATGVQTCENGFCSSILICAGSPGAAGIVPVSVSREGTEVAVRQNDSRSTMIMTLQVSGNSVAGAISGRAYDAEGMAVEVRGAGDEPATLTGAPAGQGVAGMLTGHVSVGPSSCSGNQSFWRLEPAG